MPEFDVELGRTDPIHFIEVGLGMRLHKGQKEYLKWAQKAIDNGDEPLVRRFILSCANRWGKSAMISCLQLWYLFYKFGVHTDTDESWFKIEYRTANIAPTSKLTQPVFKAMKAIMTNTYPIRDQNTGITTVNKHQLDGWFLEDKTINNPPYKLFFANNAYIENLSLMGNKGDSLQGLPYGIITYDEAARSDHLQIEIDDSILGRLLDWTAPMHLLSTPSQSSSSFLYYKDLYDEGLIGLNQSYTQTGSIFENEFMTAEQIDKQVEMLADSPLKDQMLHGKFIYGTQTIFPGQDIQDALTDELNDGIRYIEEHKYVIGVDTAIGNDEMVYQVLDITAKPYQLVWCEAVKGSSRSPQMHLNALCNLFDSYRNGNNIRMIVETFNGESARFYHDLPPYIKAATVTYGSWQPNRQDTDNDNPSAKRTSQIKKADILVALIKVLAAHEIKLPRKGYELIKQLSIYKEDDKRIPTDRTIALALAVWLAGDSEKIVAPVFRSIEW